MFSAHNGIKLEINKHLLKITILSKYLNTKTHFLTAMGQRRHHKGN